jgi:hypothetical protein
MLTESVQHVFQQCFPPWTTAEAQGIDKTPASPCVGSARATAALCFTSRWQKHSGHGLAGMECALWARLCAPGSTAGTAS